MQTPVWLAVDLGTTHTVAVVGRDGQQPRSLIFDGSPLLPSGVFLDSGGELHTGRDAQRLASSEPERFESHPKRRIDEGTVLLGEREVPIEDLLATGLRRVAEEAAASGMRPTETVLTYPADWGPVRRAVLERAAAVAGLGRVRLLPEPIAAATYCAEVLGQEIPRGGTVAIFDFGGGTFDAAVVRREVDGRLRTLAVGGLDDLGGLDIDMTLAAHLGRIIAGRDPELWRRLNEPESTADLRERLAFWNEVRAAKEMLSRTSTAPVSLPGHNPMGLHLTRDELTSLADPLVSRAVDETRRTLERAGVDPASLTALLLVGGSSRMPLVATRLHARFGIAPSVPEQPELPVAFGALRHALTEPEAQATTPMPSPPVSPVSPVTYVPMPPSMPGSPPASMPQGAAQAPGPAPARAPGQFMPQMTPQQASYTPPVFTGALPTAGRAGRRGARLAMTVSAVTVLIIVVVVALNQFNPWSGITEDLGVGDLLGDAFDSGEELAVAYEQALSGGGASAVAAADGMAIIAEVAGGKTVTTALSPEGEQLWKQEYELEPTDLYLTVVGEVVLFDATASATDEGQNLRAAVSLATGDLLWKQPWIDRNDVAFYGNDAVIEQRTAFDANAVKRIDLTTGEEVWSKGGPDDMFIIDEYRIRAETVWDEGEGGAGTPPPNSFALNDNLAVTDKLVDLDPYEGTGVVRDAADGKTDVSGDIPVDSEIWTVFDGLVIARASDEASPGRDTLVGIGLSDLNEAWNLPLDAGNSITLVKACGPHLVCVAIDNSAADDQNRTIAVDTATGQQQWSITVDWSTEEGWYTGSSGLVFGDQVFDTVDEFQLLDFEGKAVIDPEEYTSILAAGGDRAAVEKSTMSGWSVSVMDMTTGTQSAAADTGSELPEHAALAENLLVVLTGDNRALVYTIPDLS